MATIMTLIKIMYKIHLVVALPFLWSSCSDINRSVGCNSISNGHYKGLAVIFYHKPVSGSTYEMLLFPVCGDAPGSNVKGITGEDISKEFKFQKGVSFNIASDDSLFFSVLHTSHNLSLNGKEKFTKSLQSIFFNVVYIEFSNAENNTSQTTSNKTSEVNKKLNLGAGREVELTYYFSNRMEIDSLSIGNVIK
jgi:hypothetical protein